MVDGNEKVGYENEEHENEYSNDCGRNDLPVKWERGSYFILIQTPTQHGLEVPIFVNRVH